MKLTNKKLNIKKIIIAPRKLIQPYYKEIDLLLHLLGFPEALVTDLSAIFDFCPTKRKMKSISKKLGFEVTDDEYLVDVAKKIRKYKGKNEKKNT